MQASPQLLEAAAIVGALMPMLVATINQPRWPKWGRALAAVLVSAAVGTLTAATSGELTGRTLAETITVVIAATLATYHLWWRRSGITTAIEVATSRAPAESTRRLPKPPSSTVSER